MQRAVPRPSRAGLHCGGVEWRINDRLQVDVPRPSRAGLHCGGRCVALAGHLDESPGPHGPGSIAGVVGAVGSL